MNRFSKLRLPEEVCHIKDRELRRLIEQEYYVNPALALKMIVQCQTADEVRQLRREAYPVCSDKQATTLYFMEWLRDLTADNFKVADKKAQNMCSHIADEKHEINAI